MDPKYFKKIPTRTPDLLARRAARLPHIIAVEGQDDLWFLDELLSELGADPSRVQTVDYGGFGELVTYLKNLLREDLVMDGEVKSLLITGDADTFTGKLAYDVGKVLKDAGGKALGDRETHDDVAAAIPRTGLFLLPRDGVDGSLESVLLHTVSGRPAADEARAFVEAHHADRAPRNDKRVSQAYLATQPELCRGAGWGARQGYFDLTHGSLDELKTMLASFIG